MKKEKAREILRQIRDDAKKKIADAEGLSWTKVATYGNGVALIIKINCIDRIQTKIAEFPKE